MATKKLKILHIGQSLGGVDTYIRLLVGHISTESFENVLLVGEEETIPFLDRENTELKCFHGPLVRGISPLHDFRAILVAARIIRLEKPDLIHCHSSKGGLIGRIVGFLMRIKTLYTPNAFSYLSSNGFKSTIFKRYEKLFKHLGGYVLACSNSEKFRALNDLGYKRKKVFVWSNCIPVLQQYAQENTLSLPVRFITVGRPSFQKNTTFLIDLFYEYKQRVSSNFKLTILGVGHYSPLKAEIELKIREFGLADHVELVEWLPRESSLELVCESHIYISTARYEGLPYAILEAMQMGLPIVATNVDGNKDAVAEGENGFLIPENDKIAFMNALGKFIHQESLFPSFQRASKERWNEKFNIANNILDLEQLLQQISVWES